MMRQIECILPFAGDNSTQTRRGHSEKFKHEIGERTHAADGITKEFIFRKSFDHFSGETAMALPMVQQGFRGHNGCCLSLGHKLMFVVLGSFDNTKKTRSTDNSMAARFYKVGKSLA